MDQYEILRELGRGGTSVVYLLTDRADGRNYAMKVQREDCGNKPEEYEQKEFDVSILPSSESERQTKAQLQEIAEMKMPDLNAASVEAAMSMIAGTARSMGVEVVD